MLGASPAIGRAAPGTGRSATWLLKPRPNLLFNGAGLTSWWVNQPGSVLFDGSGLRGWWMNQSATPRRVRMVPDPAGSPSMVQQFTTYNTDVAPLTPTMNPRSQLITPNTVLNPGNAYWESFQVYIPRSFRFLKDGWLSLNAAVYGYPYAGSPPAEISIENGSFRFQRNAYGTDPWQIAWSTPVVKNRWYRFTWHFLFSARGWIELYVNGVQQRLWLASHQVTRMPISLLDATDSQGPWIADEQLYYQLGMFLRTSVYFKNFRIGRTKAAVES